MSNTAKFEVPDSGDNGKAYVYSSGSDSHVLTDVATQAELDAHGNLTTSVHGITDTSALVTLTGSQTLTNKTLTTPVITLEQGASVAPTAEGRIAWDTDDNQLKVGDGSGTKTFSDDSVNAATYLTSAAAPELIRDTMASALVAGANVTITPNDGADTITITASGGGGGSPALPELQTPEELWDGTASETWLIPAFAGTLAAATNEWSGGPFTFAPFYIYESITVDRVRITVPTAAAGSTVRLAAYAATSGGWPTGAALHDFGTIDTSTAGTKVLSGSWAFTSGRFWVAIWYSSQSVSIVCGNPSYDVLAGVPISAYDASGTQVRTPWPRPTTAFHATNAFPTLGGASTQTSGTNGSAIVPFVSLRRSA